ncbi:MAG: RNA 3'-terminal phosphate cyclase (ATP) [Myxococcota bacterium]|jgi:RNA 3'-terminal phosphate cyclase (ATP)
MVQIDGSMGEGGGQVLRSSLALSMITQKPLLIENIRARRRPRTGLLRQHLTGLRAAVEICGAEVEGDSLKSTRVRFTPGPVKSGRYRFAVGTAGSAVLVLQTILPALMLADGDSELVLEGGTHNSKSPPFEFLEHSFLPLLRQMGPGVELELVRPGFYPAGGGKLIARIHPAASLAPLSLTEVGERQPLRARALVSALPRGIGHQELLTLREHLPLEWPDTEIVEFKDPPGPGNSLHVFLTCGCLTEVVTGFGERKVHARSVAEAVVAEVKEYLRYDVPVGDHLADQLLLPLALAGGGRFHATPPSLHTTTNIDVIQRFLDVPFSITPLGEDAVDGAVVIAVGKDAVSPAQP